jgi:TetR/AcrR family transcriptional regulator, mexJK operon transcriptional repressor
MAHQDTNEYEQRRNQILEGALEVFSNKGFEKATNKDIAAAAGIGSPGLIYHYFIDKADLFRKAVEHYLPILSLLDHPEALMDKPPREALTMFARSLLSSLENRHIFAVYKIVISEAFRRPQIAEMLSQIGPRRGLGLLRIYIERQMELGTLRRMEVGVAVRCFMGPLIAYVVTRELFVQPDSQAITIDMMVDGAVDVFLRGMEVSENVSADRAD